MKTTAIETLLALADDYARACEAGGADPQKDAAAQSARAALSARAETLFEEARVAAVREVVGLLHIEGCEFHHNVPNDYGSVNTVIFTGKGNPWELFRGEEVLGKFRDGVRGTGRYHLNDAIIPVILGKIDHAKQAQKE